VRVAFLSSLKYQTLTSPFLSDGNVWRLQDDEEEKFRFNIFQKALNPPIPKKERGLYFPGLADRSSEELDGLDAYVFESDIVKLMYGLDAKMLYGFTQSEKVFAELKDSAEEEDSTNY
ncbi:hypothetical protein L195_g008132, partial [Trifolium pratense]